jgi:hypothetical protein
VEIDMVELVYLGSYGMRGSGNVRPDMGFKEREKRKCHAIASIWLTF